MSVVYTSKALFGLIAGDLASYVYEFWWAMDAYRIQAPVTGIFGEFDWQDYYVQKNALVYEWFRGKQDMSAVFYKRWKYWRFGDLKAADQIAEDWPPPGEFFVRRAAGAALPQTPQVRMKIPMPDGTFRRIRVKSQ